MGNREIDRYIHLYSAYKSKESLGASVAKEVCFQRSPERIEGKSRLPQSGWKIVPQSRTGCRETPVTKFVVCSWHEQLPDVVGMRPQRTTTSVRQKMMTWVHERPSLSASAGCRRWGCWQMWPAQRSWCQCNWIGDVVGDVTVQCGLQLSWLLLTAQCRCTTSKAQHYTTKMYASTITG